MQPDIIKLPSYKDRVKHLKCPNCLHEPAFTIQVKTSILNVNDPKGTRQTLYNIINGMSCSSCIKYKEQPHLQYIEITLHWFIIFYLLFISVKFVFTNVIILGAKQRDTHFPVFYITVALSSKVLT